MNTHSRAHRCLKGMERIEWRLPPDQLTSLPAPASGTTDLGTEICRYAASERSDVFVEFWSFGIVLGSGSSRQIIRYDSIDNTRLSNDEKLTGDLDLHLSDGAVATVPTHHDGRFNDALQLMRFFNRARDDIRRKDS